MEHISIAYSLRLAVDKSVAATVTLPLFRCSLSLCTLHSLVYSACVIVMMVMILELKLDLDLS